MITILIPIRIIAIIDHEKDDITTNSQSDGWLRGELNSSNLLVTIRMPLVGGRLVGLRLRLLFGYEFALYLNLLKRIMWMV